MFNHFITGLIKSIVKDIASGHAFAKMLIWALIFTALGVNILTFLINLVIGFIYDMYFNRNDDDEGGKLIYSYA